ncbi:MAG: DsbE family thiol:disulfide interchange protein [Alphaproteobacteria bacterium]|nr:DsbE family thiol:disulfide interchange protein [Alphaproteobacteria bacterium]
MRRWLFILPVLVFVVLVVGFYEELYTDTLVLPSPLIDQPAPATVLPPLDDKQPGIGAADLKGHVSLINFFASWCVPCREEHPVLNELAKAKKVPIYGVDYKDKKEAGAAWIASLGNPYTLIGADTGRVGLDWGVYGVPETFIVDATGRIRYKHVGPLTTDDIQHTILPLVAKLQR